jgi:uncharacterized protein (TIGR02147 family)
MVNIYQYLNYREYLKDYYEDIKKDKPYFSYRFMARRVGISAGYIVKVLQEKVHLGQNNVAAFADLIGLKGKKREYFQELVAFGRAKSQKEIHERFEKLQSIKGIRFRTVAEDEVEFFSSWRHMAIRSLLSIYPFTGDDYGRLGAMLSPPVSARQVKESVTLMKKLGLIKKNRDGIFQLTEKFVSTSEQWKSSVIHDYQKEMITMGLQSLDRFKKSRRDISTVTFCIPLRELETVREEIASLRHRLLRLSDDAANEDCVAQLNIQFFPLAIVDDTKGKS